MKKSYFVSISMIWILLSSCESYMSDFSPGTLGATAETHLTCSSNDVQQRIDVLLEINPYQIQAKDTANVAWWHEGGYDFLTFRCINVRKRLYMITIDSVSDLETNMSIRAYYDRNKKDWIVAKKFTPVDHYRAEKAMKYLSNEMSSCL